MTIHDRAWRSIGLLLFCAGAAIANQPGALAALIGIVLTILGIVLTVQGRRVFWALKVERSHHRDLPGRIQARRRSRD